MANVTILSGDLSENDDPLTDNPFYDNYDDNSYHVIDARFETRVRFEGFTIIGGNADYPGTEPGRLHQKHAGGAFTNHFNKFVNCIFKYNYALTTGGGISAHDTTGVVAYNCTFLLNRAGQYGGGIFVDESEYGHFIANCVFNLNVAGNSGGAVRASGGTENGCDVFLDDCTFWDNRADTGGAVKAQTYSDVWITNSIIWGHEDDDNDYQLTVDTSTSSLTVTYCDIYNEAGNQLPPGVGGSNNIFNEDPLFVDGKPGLGVEDDLRLFGGSQGNDASPCINEGDDSQLPDDLVDLNENNDTDEDIPYDRDYVARIIAEDLDMGAYEGSYYCDGDVNRDRFVDIDDVFAVLAAWGSCPDCPEDVNGDDTVDIDDLFAVLGDWFCGMETDQDAPQSVYACITLYASDPEDLATCLEAIQLTGGQ